MIATVLIYSGKLSAKLQFTPMKRLPTAPISELSESVGRGSGRERLVHSGASGAEV